MAPSRKSEGRLVVTLSIPPAKLRSIVGGEESPVSPKKEASSPKDAPEPKEAMDSVDSPATPITMPSTQTNGENASDSNPGTPANGAMGPPADAKKKGTKRSSTVANGEPKARGKPGPKKKAKMDDGTLDGIPTSRTGGGHGHKLGPKANQGAINAGLRALDRSGKPCRKWSKGGFTLKSFTGVVWEVRRWTAPVHVTPVTEETNRVEASDPGSASNKENMVNGEEKSEAASNSGVNGSSTLPDTQETASGVDVEMQSTPSGAPSVKASSPPPVSTPTPVAVAVA